MLVETRHPTDSQVATQIHRSGRAWHMRYQQPSRFVACVRQFERKKCSTIACSAKCYTAAPIVSGSQAFDQSPVAMFDES